MSNNYIAGACTAFLLSAAALPIAVNEGIDIGRKRERNRIETKVQEILATHQRHIGSKLQKYRENDKEEFTLGSEREIRVFYSGSEEGVRFVAEGLQKARNY